MTELKMYNDGICGFGSLLGAWSPEVMAISGTILLVLATVGVIAIALRTFDGAIRDGKKPSKARSRFYNQVVGWLLIAAIAIALVWVFDTWIYERLPQLG